MRRNSLFILFSLVIILTASGQLHAGWDEDGVPISVTNGYKYSPKIISDGEGGAIVAWYQATGGYNIYVQKVDGHGNVRWTVGGLGICTDPGSQQSPSLVSDGAGGAIVTWMDYRAADNDIYAQRVDSDGNALWTADGIAVCSETGDQLYPQIATDGAGGAIIAWHDGRGGSIDIFVQRIDGDGNEVWLGGGINICWAGGTQHYPSIVTDEAGGAIVIWEDISAGDGTSKLYAQRVNSSGVTRWTDLGESVASRIFSSSIIRAIPDGAGGLIVAWHDYVATGYEVFAERMSSDGGIVWGGGGIDLTGADPGIQQYPVLVSDGAKGAIIAWRDTRNGDSDIYTQRISAAGDIVWTAGGIAVSALAGEQNNPRITTDGVGGAIVTWYDERDGNQDIYAQRVTNEGFMSWTEDGEPICSVPANQSGAILTSDGGGGAIIAWRDFRNGIWDLYAQRIERNGYWGYPSPEIAGVRDIPEDEGGVLNLSWDGSRLEPWPYETVTHYTVWRAIAPTAMMQAPASVKTITDISMLSPDQTGPVLMASGGYYWYLLETVEAYYLGSYSMPVPTLFDSTAASNEYTHFQVVAHTPTPNIYWVSQPDSGYSVDNLSPAAPLALSGEQNYQPEGLTLTWSPGTEPDLHLYNVYRGSHEAFEPGTGSLLAAVADTLLFDGGWSWDAGYYYKVSAVDVHGNESGFALLNPQTLTGDEDPAMPLATSLSQNYPNPFNPSTTIRFDLKKDSKVVLSVYNANGALVATLVDGHMTAGRKEIGWNATDAAGKQVSSGVYFYRMVADEFVQTRKMVLLR